MINRVSLTWFLKLIICGKSRPSNEYGKRFGSRRNYSFITADMGIRVNGVDSMGGGFTLIWLPDLCQL